MGGQVGVFQGRISLLKLSFPICRLQNRPGVVPGSRLPPASPSSSSSGGRSIPLSLPLPIAPCTTPPFPRVPSSRKCIAQGHPPRAAAGPRVPSPSGECGGPRAHAFPYLTWTNACRQSQEFRPLTSASSAQGTARETAGRGWGGRRGRAPTSSHSRPAAEVSLFVCGFVPGARSSFPGISSLSGGESRPLQGKGRQGGRARGGRGPGGAGRCGPRAGPGQWEGECPAPPPPPEPPPPAVAAAAARSTSSPRYRSEGFLPQPRPTGATRTPDPRGRAGEGGRERGSPCSAPAAAEVRVPGREAGCTPWGRGGCGSPQCNPRPGPFWAPRGRGRARLLRAFVESQLSPRKGPRDPVTRSLPILQSGQARQGEADFSWKSSLEGGARLRSVARDPYSPTAFLKILINELIIIIIFFL